MRTLLVRIGKSRTLRLVAAAVALLSGVDDLLELHFGLTDVFGLDVAHGLVCMALTGIVEPLSKLIEEGVEVAVRDVDDALRGRADRRTGE